MSTKSVLASFAIVAICAAFIVQPARAVSSAPECASQKNSVISAKNQVAQRQKDARVATKILAKAQDKEKKAEAREMARMVKFEAAKVAPLREPLRNLRETCAALANSGACTVELAAQVESTCKGLLADEAKFKKAAEALAKLLVKYLASRETARGLIAQLNERAQAAQQAVVEAQTGLVAAENALNACLQGSSDNLAGDNASLS